MIGIDTTRVLTLIKKIASGDFKTTDLNLFILHCQAYSKACLINEIQHGRLDLNHSMISRDQIDDFALDCIADLFARDDQAQLFLIKRFFEPQLQELTKAPERVIPVLRKLIASRVHQSLIALFSRVDQGGWKIWRNLSLVPKRQPLIQEFTFLERTYLYYNPEDERVDAPSDLNPQAPPIPDELLREYLQTCLKEAYGLPQALTTILKELREQQTYQQFLSRGHIYHLLKEILNINYSDVDEIDALMLPNEALSYSEGDQGSLIPEGDVHFYLDQELQLRYIDKGKIDHELGKIYQDVLNLYFSDLLKDGFVERLPKYLLLVGQPELENHTWAIHRGRLEYMIKLGKSYIREMLESGQISNNSKMQLYT